MISFTVEDVMNVINAISIYLIAIGVVFVLAIVAIVICKNKEKHIKYLVRAQAGGAFVLALIVIINMMKYKIFYMFNQENKFLNIILILDIYIK